MDVTGKMIMARLDRLEELLLGIAESLFETREQDRGEQESTGPDLKSLDG